MGREYTVRMEDVAGTKFNDATMRVLMGQRGEGQWVHTAELPPGHVIEPHYHDVDQFQIIIKGDGTLAGEPVCPGTVHFTEKGTPYGPIVAGPEGLTFMVVRPYVDHLAEHIPTKTVLDKVRAAQREKPARV